MTRELAMILEQFPLNAPAVRCGRYGSGHIHETYLAQTQTGRRYILQKINTRAFANVAQLQENIAAITAFLRRKTQDANASMHLLETKAGQLWLDAGEVGQWRMYDFIEGGVCLEQPEREADFYQSAVAFGTFQQLLQDFPVEQLYETIPDFHNTPERYRMLRRAVREDPLGRAASVQAEIDFALRHAEIASQLTAMRCTGQLPLRVTHNDTKLNNVILDARTRKPLCVIDLDTTMPGLSAYDFGDSIRFGAATAAEDERELDKMTLSLERFETFTRGFLYACPGLTPAEREALPLGALTMTLECGVRFLTDYLQGDRYFGIRYAEHNLDRCRTQFRLAQDMERKRGAMMRIVHDAAGEGE